MTTAVGLFERGIRPVVLEHYCASNGGARSHAAALLALERLIGKEHILFGRQGMSLLRRREWKDY